MSLSALQGGVCAPKGFRASGVSAGIKASGRLDLALIASGVPAVAAGCLTTNRAAAAPVEWSRGVISGGRASAVVVNSGCANAMTGDRGRRDAARMAGEVGASLRVPPSEVAVCSTGLIGSFLPVEAVSRGILDAVESLGPGDEEAASAILTTDTRPKRSAVAHPEGWRAGGMAKGAGMIAPNMATMLAVLTTDAVVERDAFQAAVSEAVEETFNCITIDGDTSTNDSVIALASGASGIRPSASDLREAVLAVCRALATAIVADGEGATKLVRVRVRGALDGAQARRAARVVAESLLVKTALHGADPNWGRVAAALGRAGVRVDFSALGIAMGGVPVLAAGEFQGEGSLARARAGMGQDETEIECDLASGPASAEMLTTDLSPEYVRFNSAYES